MRVFLALTRNRLKTNAVPGTAFPLIGNLPYFKVVPKKKNFLGRGIQAKAVRATPPSPAAKAGNLLPFFVARKEKERLRLFS